MLNSAGTSNVNFYLNPWFQPGEPSCINMKVKSLPVTIELLSLLFRHVTGVAGHYLNKISSLFILTALIMVTSWLRQSDVSTWHQLQSQCWVKPCNRVCVQYQRAGM